jgi:hypothetical protein
MKVETFKIAVIVFIFNVIIHLTSHWPIIFCIVVMSLNTENIAQWDQCKNLQITDNKRIDE